MAEPVVFVIDDDEMSRDSICALVESMNIRTKGFPSGEAFLEAYDPDHPGCIVTDVRMKGMSGVELQERLQERGYSIPTVVITAYASTPITVRAMQNGAVTLLEKPYNEQALWDAIRRALSQDGQSREKNLHRKELQRRYDTLTQDERIVLERICEGKPNKAIAAELDVSVRTVESRRHNVFKKTDTESVAELVRFVLMLRGEAASEPV